MRFDVARGLSAIVVLLAHVSQVFFWAPLGNPDWIAMPAGILARAAVLVFFLLSGLLITRSILSNIGRNRHFDPADYSLSRVARIYPPFLFAVILTIAIVTLIWLLGLPGYGSPLGELRPSGLTFNGREVWHAMLLYDGLIAVNGPLWTLYIEFNLYIVAMGLALALASRSQLVRMVGLALSVMAIKIGLHHVDYLLLAGIWIFGAALNFRLVKEGSGFTVCAIILILWSALTVKLTVPPPDYLDGHMYSVALQAAGCVAFSWFYLLSPRAERPWPKWMVSTAAFSYTLYVTHFPILALGLSISLAIGATTLGGAVIAAPVSAATAIMLAIIASKPLESQKRFKRMMILALQRWTFLQ